MQSDQRVLGDTPGCCRAGCSGAGSAVTQGIGSLDTALNPRVASVRPSKTMVMTDLARAMRESGVDVIALTAGEPDFDTPAPILEAGHEALRCGLAQAPPELRRLLLFHGPAEGPRREATCPVTAPVRV